MAIYTARIGHSDSDIPGDLQIDAQTDDEAISAVRSFVVAGYRNLTWASLPLSDGRQASYRNEHGRAVGGVL